MSEVRDSGRKAKRITYVDRSDLARQYEEFLNPDVLRPRLLIASVFIAAFESLKDAIVSQPRSLFWLGFDERGEQISPRYREQVLSRHKDHATASLLWFQEAGAVDERDLEAYDRIRRCRNTLAHELLELVSTGGLPADLGDRFDEIIALIRKIDVWWLVNFELDTDPVWADKQIDEDTILPGRQIALHLLYDVALGTEEERRHWYEGFKERVKALGLRAETVGVDPGVD